MIGVMVSSSRYLRGNCAVRHITNIRMLPFLCCRSLLSRNHLSSLIPSEIALLTSLTNLYVEAADRFCLIPPRLIAPSGLGDMQVALT